MIVSGFFVEGRRQKLADVDFNLFLQVTGIREIRKILK